MQQFSPTSRVLEGAEECCITLNPPHSAFLFQQFLAWCSFFILVLSNSPPGTSLTL